MAIVHIMLIIFSEPYIATAKEESPFDETVVYFNVAGLGSIEIEAVIQQGEAYLSITDVFDYLKIKNTPSSDLNEISGSFIEPTASYTISKINNQIIIRNKIYVLTPGDLIQTPMALYLKSTVFGKVFDLHCVFDMRNLAVNMSTKLDLPVIRERRQELMRNNISKFKNEVIADTIIKRKFTLFNFGALDWSIASTQQMQGFNTTQVYLRLGTIVAGGETNISLNYNSPEKPNLQQQQYLWRYVNNDNKVLRQVLVGKIPTQSVSSLLGPVIGFQFTNTPTIYRRSFGTYTISDSTEPDWMVELYVNDVLLDYVKADASGFFTFKVPLVYGSSVVKLRFFGPWGEERIREQNINIPYNFLPKNELEYRLSAGVLEDSKQSKFSRADFKYGLSRNITIGGGVEYLSSLNQPTMPFINASFKLASNLLLTSDYTYGVKTRTILNYNLRSNLLIELNYSNYDKAQTAINQSFLEERKVTISKSFRGNKLSGFSRLTVNQIVYPTVKQTLSEFLISATTRSISLNLTTFALFMAPDYVDVYSNLAIALRFPSRFTLRPQIQYSYTRRRINEVRFELEKQLFRRGFFNLSYENNLNSKAHSFGLGLRFELSFARVSALAQQGNNGAVFTQTLRGGAFYDGKTNYFNMNNRINTSRSGFVVYPFLDLNSNNRRDENEPKVEGLKLKINGGRVHNNVQDTTIQIFDLEPYTSYLLELNPQSFDNIAWQLKNKTFKIITESNKLKLIEVPVRVYGEISGMVLSSTGIAGQGRIIVNFYRSDLTLAGSTVTESDGYFSFIGLSPGSYTASLNKGQLKKLKMAVSSPSIAFNIAALKDGDVVNNIEFKLINTK